MGGYGDQNESDKQCSVQLIMLRAKAQSPKKYARQPCQWHGLRLGSRPATSKEQLNVDQHNLHKNHLDPFGSIWSNSLTICFRYLLSSGGWNSAPQLQSPAGAFLPAPAMPGKGHLFPPSKSACSVEGKPDPHQRQPPEILLWVSVAASFQKRQQATGWQAINTLPEIQKTINKNRLEPSGCTENLGKTRGKTMEHSQISWSFSTNSFRQNYSRTTVSCNFHWHESDESQIVGMNHHGIWLVKKKCFEMKDHFQDLFKNGIASSMTIWGFNSDSIKISDVPNLFPTFPSRTRNIGHGPNPWLIFRAEGLGTGPEESSQLCWGELQQVLLGRREQSCHLVSSQGDVSEKFGSFWIERSMESEALYNVHFEFEFWRMVVPWFFGKEQNESGRMFLGSNPLKHKMRSSVKVCQ